MTRLHAVRVAAQIRQDLKMEVDVIGGPYGRFEVKVDGRTALEGGRLAMLGVLPSTEDVLGAVRRELQNASPS